MTTLDTDGVVEHRLEFAAYADLRTAPAGYTWTDITWYLLPKEGLTLQYGGTSESSQNATTFAFTLKNPNGEFTVDNPASPWPGQFDRGVPVRHSTRTDGSTWVVESVTYVQTIEYTTAGSARSDGVNARVRVGCAGRLTWVAQWDPAPDAVTQAIAAAAPAHWLPLDRPSAAGTVPSGLPGGLPGSVEGFVDAGDASVPPGAYTMTKFSVGTRVALPITTPTGDASGWAISVMVKAPDNAVHDSLHTYGYVYSTGDLPRIGLGWMYLDGVGEVLHVAAYRPDGSTAVSGIMNMGSVGLSAYRPLWVDLAAVQDGIDVDLRLTATNWTLDQVTGQPINTTNQSVVTVPSIAAGRISPVVEVSPWAQLDGWGVAHLVVWPSVDASYSMRYDAAMVAYTGEQVMTRMSRCCWAAGVPEEIDLSGGDLTEPMGPQTTNKLIDTLRACELTDHGIMDDHLGAITYAPRHQLTNQTPVLVLDGAAGHLPADLPPPQLTDARLRNRVTTSMTYGGASATVEDAASIAKSGLIAYSPPGGVNLASSRMLASHASWSLAHGRLREPAYPALPVRLSINPSLVAQWRSVGLGSLVEVRNPPRPHRGPWRIQVRGVTVVWSGTRSWRASVVGVPYRPWETAAVGTFRPDIEATLHLDMDDEQTYAVVDTAGPLITTDPADYPVDLQIGLERVTATACTGTSNPQTLTLVRAVDGYGGWHLEGETVSLWRPPLIGL